MVVNRKGLKVDAAALIIALLMPDPKSLVYMISSCNDSKDQVL